MERAMSEIRERLELIRNLFVKSIFAQHVGCARLQEASEPEALLNPTSGTFDIVHVSAGTVSFENDGSEAATIDVLDFESPARGDATTDLLAELRHLPEILRWAAKGLEMEI
jgi:hypothetical protein